MASVSFTTAQLATQTVAQLNSLSSSQFAGFSAAQIQALNGSQLNGLSKTNFNAIPLSFLTKTQISALSGALANLSAAQTSSLTTTDISYFTGGQFALIGADFLSAFSASQAAAIGAAQLTSIAATNIAKLSTNFLNELTTTQIGALTKAQVQAFTGAQLTGLKASSFAALNPAKMTAFQIEHLSSTRIASLSVSNFDTYVAPNIAALAATALNGITIAQLASLGQSRLASFSASQIASMSTAADAYVTDYNGVVNDASAHLSGGSLSFSAATAVLQDAAVGGMSAGKFAALKTIATELNASGGGVSIGTTAMVQQLFDDVVLGNAANAHWNGGASTATSLGNLSATSSAMQANELVGKWFIGSDDPSVAGFGIPISYKSVSGSLFSSAGPVYTDVNQGYTGDCYFLSALGETALQDPSLINNMITDNGNGVYTVDFHLNGKDDYVTVNSDIAYMGGGHQFGDGSTVAFDHGPASGSIWTEIVEKAYVEFRAQTDGVNSYANISGGWDEGLNAITGQNVNDFFAESYTTAASVTSLLALMNNAFNAKEAVMINTNNDATSLNLVGDHMYMVIGVNTAAGTVTLDNPWNGSGTGTGLKMQFTDSMSSLIAAGVDFHVATGTPALA
jgi:hypothetical protein